MLLSRAAAVALAASVLASACGPSRSNDAAIRSAMEAVRPLHEPLGEPKPDEWLAQFPEPEQTFDEYLGQSPVTPQGERHVLYVQPIGELSRGQRRIVALTAEFLGLCFGLPVQTLDDLPLGVVPESARRHRSDLGTVQIEAGYVTMQVLRPRLPADAAACIALTSADLWPGNEWNFVFGQASTRDRVGVWSLYRFGNPDTSQQAFRDCLLRTLKTACHETGHMFTILHCTRYHCCMQGSIGLRETDRLPLEFCPECMAKICWATKSDPATRFRRLAEFCRTNAMAAERLVYERSLAAVEGRPLPGDDAFLNPAERTRMAEARAEIGAFDAVRAEAWNRGDAGTLLSRATWDFSIQLAGGVSVGGREMAAMLADGWRHNGRTTANVLAIVSLSLRGDEVEAVIRHEYVGPSGTPGSTIYRETWTRTADGWRLRRVEEL